MGCNPKLIWSISIVSCFILCIAGFLPSSTVVADRLCFHRCLSVHRGEVCHPLGRHPLVRHPCSRRPLQPTVRILLECILVSSMYLWCLCTPLILDCIETNRISRRQCHVVGVITVSTSSLTPPLTLYTSEFWWILNASVRGRVSRLSLSKTSACKKTPLVHIGD